MTDSDSFFHHPILNSPYTYPSKHWELDESGQPTQHIIHMRRSSKHYTPIPKPKTSKGKAVQPKLDMGDLLSLNTSEQTYDTTGNVNLIRAQVDEWRSLPEADWKVTPVTAQLLGHWRTYEFQNQRPFFCQIEAVETAIWLDEVAPQTAEGKRVLAMLAAANNEANPDLFRIALKLATGAGKTTVMAMLIAWQTLNAIRQPRSKRFTKGFLIVAPGLTIRDRLRVLQPNDPENYYEHREIVPHDLRRSMYQAQIVITNYHAFRLRERVDISRGGRALLQGRGEAISTLETEGQMLQRVLPSLMGLRNIMVINDEAHHCYREKPNAEQEKLKGEERQEAEANNEAARLWLTGLEIVNRRLGVRRVMDLSATPFFLRGSGYAEGTIFPWTVSDFSLMDAIECGIVKLPRVPVAENVTGNELPVYRNLWEHIRADMPKKGRGAAGGLDPQKLPEKLKTALTALYGHYAGTFEVWQSSGVEVPPCFIIVCNNTSTSKLVFDYISGYQRADGLGVQPAALPLFSNFDAAGQPLPKPRTLLIDSEQLESGEALDRDFREAAAEEIEQFRREVRARGGSGEKLTDQDILREVMNTVGKEGRLGGSIRCVVSVSMLTEGWDANTVTHILGVRAFGTQLLCEQVIGRALRRQSYHLNEQGLFDAEYADVLGIPFDFNAKPVIAPPQPARKTVQVRAVRPERDHLELTFPRLEGYRIELPKERLSAQFTEDSRFVLTPDHVGPTRTTNAGIIGEEAELTVEHLGEVREATIAFELAKHIMNTRWRDTDEAPPITLFGPLKRIVTEWLETQLECKGGTQKAQLLSLNLKEQVAERIQAAIVRQHSGQAQVRAIIDPYNPVGSTAQVRFTTSKSLRYTTNPTKCHVNYAVLDSEWEGELCQVIEAHPAVISYVKNQGLGLEIPYHSMGRARRYIPDFLVKIDGGIGADGQQRFIHLILEVKGYRNEEAKDKKIAAETYWIPAVNASGQHGEWKFAEFLYNYDMQADFASLMQEAITGVPNLHLRQRNLLEIFGSPDAIRALTDEQASLQQRRLRLSPDDFTADTTRGAV